jgi:hypothetical protein
LDITSGRGGLFVRPLPSTVAEQRYRIGAITRTKPKKRLSVKYWEIIADNLSTSTRISLALPTSEALNSLYAENQKETLQTQTESRLLQTGSARR